MNPSRDDRVRSSGASRSSSGTAASPWPRLAIAAAVSIAVDCASAQTREFNTGIAVQETATNNVNLTPSDQRTSDLVTQITPSLSFRETGSNSSAQGSITVPILLYVRTGNENNSVYPLVDILGDVNTLDHRLHLEGAVNISEQLFTPFGAQPVDLTNATNNRYRASTYRISPYYQGNAGNDLTYELRNNNIWANLSGAPISTNNSLSSEFLATVQTSQQRQFAWSASYDYVNTRFYGQSGSLTTQLARVAPSYAVDGQLRVDLRGGYEDNQYTLTSSHGPIYGAGLHWRPTERTDVKGWWEHRFFGASYSVSLDHRTPLSVWNIQASRNITTYPQELASLGAGANVASYLNNLFLSTYPDAAQRQQAVDQFLRDRGLGTTLANPVVLYAEQILLVQQSSATIGFIGARNAIFLSAFNAKNEPITAAGNPLPPSIFTSTNNTQTGATVSWSNRLTQSVNVNLALTGLRTVANEPSQGMTKQAYATILFTTPITARVTGFAGARYQTLTSDTSFDYNEAAVYVGLAYTLR